jgi:bifunctional DNA-binding transcriptional regulator/antitoxin component of YhaV-PrlF toxin-antitoxin module
MDTLRMPSPQCKISFYMEKVRITRAGQLSLPARIRRRWGTASVSIEDRGESVVLRPIPDDPIAAAAGALKGRIGSTEELRARAREDERHAIERREG